MQSNVEPIVNVTLVTPTLSEADAVIVTVVFRLTFELFNGLVIERVGDIVSAGTGVLDGVSVGAGVKVAVGTGVFVAVGEVDVGIGVFCGIGAIGCNVGKFANVLAAKYELPIPCANADCAVDDDSISQ